eukprot:TRINITY_DN110326_c0_g1_i1.p1 TRINITY_DN110326_c0_g1~~TRINITY_DN110326_c0_g1_i1.p1  ORF type:complete len:112 (+),score=6.23 TRINITY_DN110326_c0_g1_i1:43-336(+)
MGLLPHKEAIVVPSQVNVFHHVACGGWNKNLIPPYKLIVEPRPVGWAKEAGVVEKDVVVLESNFQNLVELQENWEEWKSSEEAKTLGFSTKKNLVLK